jgi:hypothetical protein
MRTIRPLKKRVKSPPTSEWLRVVESFENLMEERVSEDAPRTKESLIDKDTLLVVTKAYDVTLRYYTAVLGGRNMGVSSLMNDIELACLLLPRGKG